MKTINGLMKHLRASNIKIGGAKEKRQLINSGYFHGYKGYRFFQRDNNIIPFSSYEEVNATIEYDSKLKAMIYSRMMYIETALKNIALDVILNKTGSESIDSMLSKAVCGYSNTIGNLKAKHIAQQHKLALQKDIMNLLSEEYSKNNPQIVHYYERGKVPPVWALFENLTMGKFGNMLRYLTFDVRDEISKRIGLSTTYDCDRKLLGQYVIALRNLRNAIAHNGVIFDTRFNRNASNTQNNNNISNEMKMCLVTEFRLPYVSFTNLGDYIILMCFIMKKLGVTKTEIKAFIREYEKIIDEYKSSVSQNVVNVVIQADLRARINLLKNSI